RYHRAHLRDARRAGSAAVAAAARRRRRARAPPCPRRLPPPPRGGAVFGRPPPPAPRGTPPRGCPSAPPPPPPAPTAPHHPVQPLMGQSPEPEVVMPPTDLAERSLATGNLVRIASRRGTAIMKPRASEDLRPGDVFIAMHWGERFMSGAGANALTVPAVDPRS